MADFMAFRGPDAQEIWIDGNVGFGHALLKTTDDSERERQPFTFDGRVWIVADARVDARTELIAMLKAKGQEDHIWQVQKGLYGLPQGSRIWNKAMNKGMLCLGFARIKCEYCLYF